MSSTGDGSKQKGGRGARETTKADTPQTGPDEDETSHCAKVEACGQPTDVVIHSTAKENRPPIFGRSRPAVQALASALRHDLGTIWRRTSARLLDASRILKEQSRNFNTSQPGPRLEVVLSRLAVHSAKIRSVLLVKLSLMPPFKRVRWRSWGGIFTLVSVSCLLVSASLVFLALKDVPWREIADGSLKPTVVLVTADGQPLVRQGPFQGPPAGYAQFPSHLVDAVLSIEDRRFLDHYGIDLRGISRALVRNFQAGEVVQGGSTITQQLIKVLYLESDRTLKRKIQEVVIAFWLEWKLGKREILTRYLNSVYLGAGATGMPAAARVYFDKDIGALDIRESAMLAGLLKAPSQLNPINNFDGARQRTTTVLDAMVENGKLKPDEAKAAKAEFAALHVTAPTPRAGSWFADWVSGQA